MIPIKRENNSKKRSWLSGLFSRRLNSIRGSALSPKDYVVVSYDQKSLLEEIHHPIYQVSPLTDGTLVIRDQFEEIGKIQIFRLRGTKFKVLRIDCGDMEIGNLLCQKVSQWAAMRS